MLGYVLLCFCYVFPFLLCFDMFCYVLLCLCYVCVMFCYVLQCVCYVLLCFAISFLDFSGGKDLYTVFSLPVEL